MSETVKRRFGDRRDGRWVRDVPGLTTIMMHLMPSRTAAEVYVNEKIDVTDLLQWLEKKNAQHPEYKTTLMHCFIVAIARMIRERPKMNRFIQGRRMYERYNISLSFVAKRRFSDHAEEALMFFTPKDTDTLDTLSDRIAGQVKETKKSEHSTGGIDATVDAFAKIPRLLLIPIIGIIRCLDFWGVNPKFITDGDPNYSSIFLSNLGSIKCPAVYHHLNNYGTNSFMLTIGTMHKEKVIMDDGSEQIRDFVDIGVTIDERIGDGFYFARSLKLVKYLFAHPQMLDEPLAQPSNFDYK